MFDICTELIMNGQTACTFLSFLTEYGWPLPGRRSTKLHSTARHSEIFSKCQDNSAYKAVEFKCHPYVSHLPVNHLYRIQCCKTVAKTKWNVNCLYLFYSIGDDFGGSGCGLIWKVMQIISLEMPILVIYRADTVTPQRACDIIVACVVLRNTATFRGKQHHAFL